MDCEKCEPVKDEIVRKLEAVGFKAVPVAEFPSDQEVLDQYRMPNVATITILREDFFEVYLVGKLANQVPHYFTDIEESIAYALSPLPESSRGLILALLASC